MKKSLSNNDSLLCGIKTIISMMIAITVIILFTSSLFSVYALYYWASPSQPIQFFRQKLENIEVNVYYNPKISKGGLDVTTSQSLLCTRIKAPNV